MFKTPWRTGQLQRRMAAVLAVLVLLFTGLADIAQAGFGFSPNRYKSGYTYGNGIYFATYDITIHAEPDEQSDVLQQLRWSRDTQSNSVTSTLYNTVLPSDHVFFCFYPGMDVAMMAVVGETEDGWVEVVYDQAKKKTGWVRTRSSQKVAGDGQLEGILPAHMGVYQTWLEFMRLNALPNGIYWLGGVSQYHRSVRSKDQDDAKFVPVTIIRDIKVRHVRGNWLLVEVYDFERNTPMGWVRWRDNDGNLLVFPNLSGKHVPVVTTAY